VRGYAGAAVSVFHNGGGFGGGNDEALSRQQGRPRLHAIDAPFKEQFIGGLNRHRLSDPHAGDGKPAARLGTEEGKSGHREGMNRQPGHVCCR